MALTIGILGGMGPAATLDLLARIQAATPTSGDADHLRVVVDIDPSVPDRNRALAGEGPSPGPALVRMAQGLERQGADLLAIACNAAHGWATDIRAGVAVPLVSMVEETVALLARDHAGRRIGLMAADATRRAGLYDADVELGPAEQARLMRAIYRVKAGERGAELAGEMTALAAGLAERGAEVIVAGCTEVPLLLDRAPVPLVDPADILAGRLVALARA